MGLINKVNRDGFNKQGKPGITRKRKKKRKKGGGVKQGRWGKE